MRCLTLYYNLLKKIPEKNSVNNIQLTIGRDALNLSATYCSAKTSCIFINVVTNSSSVYNFVFAPR